MESISSSMVTVLLVLVTLSVVQKYSLILHILYSMVLPCFINSFCRDCKARTGSQWLFIPSHCPPCCYFTYKGNVI